MAKVKKPATTNISPPKKKKAASTSVSSDATAKPALEEVKPIQFKIPAHLHQEIKMYSVGQNMSMTELFTAMYKEYRANHG